MPETLATIQTPPGRGGIAVIVLSGAQAQTILDEVFSPLGHREHPCPIGRMQLGTIARGGRVIDQALVCRRTDAVEINIHGGPAVARAVMELLADRGATIETPDHAPPALPTAHPEWDNPAVGEEMLRVLPGAASHRVLAAVANQWSAGLSRLARQALRNDADPLPQRLRRAAAALDITRKLLSPPSVVLVGPPNAGKSTLTNALVARPVSIVHPHPGTTRDWVRELALLEDLPVSLTDTAGLWEAPQSDIDAEAMTRARQCAHRADLVLLVGDGAPPPLPPWLADTPTLRIANKTDLHGPAVDADVNVSAVTGEGLDDLGGKILAALADADLDVDAPMAFTQRQANCLNKAAAALDAQNRDTARATLVELLEGRPPDSHLFSAGSLQ